MRHRVIGSTVLVTALLVTSSAFGGIIYSIDTPRSGATVAGIVEVAGWILDDGEPCGPPPWGDCEWEPAIISNIVLYVDGVFIAEADTSIPRYDVLQAYPWYAGTVYGQPGFSVSFDADSLTPGNHAFFVRVTFSDGSTQDIPAGGRTVNVDDDLNQAPFGELELPGEFQPMNGIFPVTGWALDDEEIDDIELLIDGQVVPGTTSYGVRRPDIRHRFPSHPDAEYAGFVRMFNTAVLPNGTHIVAVRLRDNAGATRVVGRRFVQVMNVGANLAPIGRIDWPITNHIMFAVGCDDPGSQPSVPPFERPENVELVSGWALDVGSEVGDDGVKWVELYINGVYQSSTLRDEFWYQAFQMDVNYYGHERLDVWKLFPDVPAAKDSGFTFAVDIADLIINKGYHQGLHYLSIRAGDIAGNTSFIHTIPVIFDCDDDPDRPSWGDIYTPPHMERVSGSYLISGWAIDYDFVEEVQIWIDGVRYDDLVSDPVTYGLATPEVVLNYPWYPTVYSRYAGYEYILDTTRLTDGEHRLVIRTKDRFGQDESIVGERLFVIDNLN